MRRKVIGCLMGALAAPVLACEMPDEGNMPMRRAVSKVATQNDVEAWAEHMRSSKASVQYLVRLDEPVHRRGLCYWPVEVRADGKLWRRYLVTPDGKKLLTPAE